MLMCQILPRSVYSVALGQQKTPNFAIFGLWCFVVLWIGCLWRKLNAGAQQQNLPLSNSIRTVSVLQCLQGKIVHTNSVLLKPVLQKCDVTRVTDTHTHPNPSPTELGMAIEDLEHVLSPWKRFGVQYSFSTTEHWKFVGNPTSST